MDDVVRRARVETWFRADADRVLAFLLHRTDRDTAQDVLQEVFVIAYRKAEVVPEPATGWLFGTARRVLANTTRGQRRRDVLARRIAAASQVDDVSGALSSPPDDDHLGESVRIVLAAMSPADREVLTLSAWYELSADEAAQALGCTRSAYGVRLHRARRRFADLMSSRDHRNAASPDAVDPSAGVGAATIDGAK